MRRTLFALLLVVAAACGARPAPMPAAPAPTAGTPIPMPSDGVAAVITGVPVVSGDGAVEWCPSQPGPDGCPGITVDGLSADALERIEGTGRLWAVEGVYDGVTLQVTGGPQPVERPESDFTTPCADLRGRHGGSGGIDPAASDAIQRHLAAIPERNAGTWWDGDNAVMTVLLTGDDVSEHRAALEEAVGDRGTVCVVGGARWSMAELEQAQQRAMQIARDAGMGPWSASADVVSNRVDLDVERSDEVTRDRIRKAAGDAVRVHAYLALRDATLDDLPAPPSRGDVELETAQTRGAGGMEALGVFTLRYDQRGGCVYGEFGRDRTGLLWPFGYHAESDPLRVYDEDGRLVAQDGDVLESGGGHVERDGGEVCGTREIWVMNGAPMVVGPSER
jgi:hypothetical protein